jgi:alpha-tubulin suppressor-like RCC1 family protein
MKKMSGLVFLSIIIVIGFQNCNKYGSNLQPSSSYLPNSETSETNVPVIPEQTVFNKNIVAGGANTCALTDQGKIKCWGVNGGYDDNNVRGDKTGDMAALDNVNLGIGRNAKGIAAGMFHSCVILDNNQVKCWGYNSNGQLGYDDAKNRGVAYGEMADLRYVNLGVGRTAKSITVAPSNTCAILDNDKVKCWGFTGYQEVGHPEKLSIGDNVGEMAALDYVKLGINRTAKSISLGSNHVCAILDNDLVKCWGDNYRGSLGYDNNVQGLWALGVSYRDPFDYVNLGVGRTAKSISAGDASTCAILDNGQLKCWGNNEFGQLGYDDTTSRGDKEGDIAALKNVNLGVGRTAKSIAAGIRHTCVILDNNQVKCWGSNVYGQLGLDDFVGRGNKAGDMAVLDYVNLGIGRTAKNITVGHGHTCVILDNDRIKCWGNNQFGQLGYDDTTSRGNKAGDMSFLDYVKLLL